MLIAQIVLALVAVVYISRVAKREIDLKLALMEEHNQNENKP
jgi:hypothetical protein